MIETRASGNDHVWTGFAIDPGKKSETLRRDFRIGQNIFDRGEFGFRQKLRARKPVEQGFIGRILGAHAWAEDPDSLVDMASDHRGEKCPRRLDGMRKFYRCALPRDLIQLACNRLRVRDTLKQLGCQLFLHREWSPKSGDGSKADR